MKQRIIFLDGEMIRADEARINSLAPGIVKGRGVFETMRVEKSGICDRQEHLDRLFKGLRLLGLRAPYSQKRLEKDLYRTVRCNRLKRGGVRLAVWREGRSCRVSIVCRPFDGYPPVKYGEGFKAVLSKIKREKTRFSHIKSLDYACFRQAFLEARDAKCDEAILLNNRAEIVEGSRTNIFFVKKGVLYTPAVKCGCLNGITRRQVIRWAREEKIPFKTVAASISQLLKADEAFVTNSLVGILPLTVVRGRPIGPGHAGPVTRKLLSAYRTNAHSSCRAQSKSV